MSHGVTSLCLVSFLFGLSVSSPQAQTLDQFCDPAPDPDTNYAYGLAFQRGGSTEPGNELYQNFVPMATPLVKVDVRFSVSGTVDDPTHFRLRILDPSHNELSSQTVEITAPTYPWVEVPFDRPVDVNTGNTYTIAASWEGRGTSLWWTGGVAGYCYPQAGPDPTDQIPDDKLVTVDWPFKTYTSSIVVTSLADSGPGSLRQAILDALPGAWLTFSPGLAGGAIVLTGGELVVDKNMVIQGPGAELLAVDGGGVDRVFEIRNGADVKITGLTVQNGNAPSFSARGGGILVEDGGTRLTLVDSAVRDNTAWGGGGISATSNTEITLVRDAIHGNAASGYGGGGGISIDNATVVITTTTISGNSSAGSSGGLSIFSEGVGLGSVSIASSTIADNTSGYGAGGIRVLGAEPTTLSNMIVAGNTPLDCETQSGQIVSNGHNLDSDDSCSFDQSTDLPGTTDPLLGPLQDNGGPTVTHELLSGSPAIDAGGCATSEITDQRGFPRPIDTPAVPNVGDGCDIGASESQLVVTRHGGAKIVGAASVTAANGPGSRPRCPRTDVERAMSLPVKGLPYIPHSLRTTVKEPHLASEGFPGRGSSLHL